MKQSLEPKGSATGPANEITLSSIRRIGGIIGIVGALTMAAGAVLMFSSGFDWLTAVEEREMDTFLTDVVGHSTLMYIHLGMWIAGATLMSLSIALFASASRISAVALIARFAATAAAGAVLVFFPLVIGVIYGFSGQPDQELAATAMTAAAVFADGVATWLILGVGATLVVFAGRDTWAPKWLLWIAGVNAIVAVLYILSDVVPVEPISLFPGLLLVLTGEILMVLLGIVGLRGQKKSSATP